MPMLKEWAYAGFTFTFVGAAWSHAASNQPGAVLIPLASLVVLTISCALRPASRRVTTSHYLPESQGTHGTSGCHTADMRGRKIPSQLKPYTTGQPALRGLMQSHRFRLDERLH
jgi:hypothetical protein